MADRTLDAECEAAYFSTAHIARGLPGSGFEDHQVESGWQKYRASDGTVHLCEFQEKQVDADFLSFDADCDGATNLSYGSNSRFGVFNEPGTSKWTLSVNFLDGNGWHDRHTWQTTYDRGFAEGETEKKGNETVMWNTHTNLEFFSVSAGDWHDYPGVNCIQDEAPDWSCHRDSDPQYHVNPVDNAC